MINLTGIEEKFVRENIEEHELEEIAWTLTIAKLTNRSPLTVQVIYTEFLESIEYMWGNFKQLQNRENENEP